MALTSFLPSREGEYVRSSSFGDRGRQETRGIRRYDPVRVLVGDCNLGKETAGHGTAPVAG